LLIGARTKDVEEELGVDIDEEKETERSADLFKELRLRREQIPLKLLLKGKFPGKEEISLSQEVKQLSKEEYPGAKGGKIGGRAAATNSTSAAAIAKMLSVIQFPRSKDEIKNMPSLISKARVADTEAVLGLLDELSPKEYSKYADGELEIGRIK
jgi:hypothetical protein